MEKTNFKGGDAARFYPAPGTRRAYLHQPCDNRIVVARPDLKFQIYNSLDASYKTGFGLALHQPGQLDSFDFTRVEQRFEAGAFPLLKQQISQAGYRFFLESFTTRDGAGRGVVMLRLTCWRLGDTPSAMDLGFLMVRGRSYSSHENEDYIPFEPWGKAWEDMLPFVAHGNCVSDGTYVMGMCRHTSGVVMTPGAGAEVWAFRIEAGREAPETLEILIPYEGLSKPVDEMDRGLDFQAGQAFRLAQRDELASLDFHVEGERQRLLWAGQLSRATRIQVPDPLVQSVYQTLTLNNLQFLGGAAGSDVCRPGQGGFNDFSTVYAWEASHYLVQMCRQGFHSEVRRVLDYLLTTQSIKGPDGDFTDVDGCFRPMIHWVNETGAVLQIFAEYAFASGDFKRLRQDARALVQAARWIQRQRSTTRDLLADGGKALHYGLLPKGRPHDWPIRGHFLFSDTHTWSGLNRMAQAFEVAGLPDAGWLRQEADEYRDCILLSVRRSLKPHPCDPKLAWIPSDLYEDPAEALKTTIFCGPISLVASGILDPGDALIPQIEDCLRAANSLNDHFAFRMRLMEDEKLRELQHQAAAGPVDLYYVTLGESPWHRTWLECGQREKAQTFFDMTLAYSVSSDLHLAQERFCPQLPWLLPWQPNGSGNGRMISMILANLCYVRDKTCHLFQGVPDVWFASQAPLGLDHLWISGTRFSFKLESGTPQAGRKFSFQCDGPWLPERFVLSLPLKGEKRRHIELSSNGRSEGAFFLDENGAINETCSIVEISHEN